MKKLIMAGLLILNMAGMANTAFAATATAECEIKNNFPMARRAAIVLAQRELAAQLNTNSIKFVIVDEHRSTVNGINYYSVTLQDK